MRSWELKSFNVNGRLEKGSCVHFLAKIYKPNNPGRPIVSAWRTYFLLFRQNYGSYRQNFTIIH